MHCLNACEPWGRSACIGTSHVRHVRWWTVLDRRILEWHEPYTQMRVARGALKNAPLSQRA